MSLLRHKPTRSRLLLTAAVMLLDLALLPNDSQSCSGGFGEPTVINSKETLLGMPSARFAQEIARIKVPATPFKYVDPTKTSTESLNTDADLNDLIAFLKTTSATAEQQKLLRDSAVAVRNAFSSYEIPIQHDRITDEARDKEPPPTVQVDPNLPVEFREYLNGWSAYQCAQEALARKSFLKVLDLPAEQQQWRGIWAAYMMGRTYQIRPLITVDIGKAIPWLIKTRELAAAGAHDTLGLAAASYGWQARAELDQKHFDAAIELYLTQRATGDPTAVHSLQLTCVDALAAGDEALNAMALNGTSRAVMTSFIVAMGGPWQAAPKPDRVAAWLKAIEAANIPMLDNADRLAWSAYEYGHYDLAARWVAKADAQSGITQWVASKLALRDGKVDEAMKLLAHAAEHFPVHLGGHENDDDRWSSRNFDVLERVRGELGALLLARSKYVESLELLYLNGYWGDAAYIAECVLTVDELKAYIDRAKPPVTTRPIDPAGHSSLNALLARRLVRLGRWKDARPYFDQEEQKVLDEYISNIRNGHDSNRTAIDRGRSMWRAAQVAREDGMQLLGTELGPDMNIYDGAIDGSGGSVHRNGGGYKPLAPSGDELKRMQRPPEQLDKRFHYRYVAADHAWAAAQLLTDNTEELANVLNTAGGWLKAKDPQSADRFYKALVRRCPNTEIGKKAIAAHWLVGTQ